MNIAQFSTKYHDSEAEFKEVLEELTNHPDYEKPESVTSIFPIKYGELFDTFLLCGASIKNTSTKNVIKFDVEVGNKNQFIQKLREYLPMWTYKKADPERLDYIRALQKNLMKKDNITMLIVKINLSDHVYKSHAETVINLLTEVEDIIYTENYSDLFTTELQERIRNMSHLLEIQFTE